MSKVTVRYVGPGMAILAGRAIWPGESRETSRAALDAALKNHQEEHFEILFEEEQFSLDEKFSVNVDGDLMVSGKVIQRKSAETEDVPAGEPALTKDVMATDAAIRVAAENGIDLSTVAGTGKDGTITKADVEKAASGEIAESEE